MSQKGKKNTFSDAMDRKLKNLVEIYGTNNWNMISRNFRDKSAQKCKERWKLFLSPSNERIPWSADEDKLLLRLHCELGNKWTTISLSFSRRTQGDIRSRFLKLKRQERKLLKANNKSFTNVDSHYSKEADRQQQ